MTETRQTRPATPEVVVYGAATCEDTAITRSRLRALGVPFREIDIDANPDGLARVLALEGRRVTPTVVVGDERVVLTEPSIEALQDRLRSAGASFRPPVATQLGGPLSDRSIPLRTLRDAAGNAFTLDAYRGQRTVALFLAHDASCLACHGYAKQLAGRADAMRDVDGQAVIVVPTTHERVHPWAAEMPPGAVLLADADAGWRRAIDAFLSLEGDGVLLLVLDRFAAPRAISWAEEAGGLISPAEATEWLRFLGLECPECGNDVSWPD